ncbi:MAG: single-stranded nucleic acid binding protein [Verrucomicrobiales bacterium]|nr:single-stranded nucleic acid binding protein [Verrucomicrobiales bacterium]
MSAQAKTILEDILKSLGFNATVETQDIDGGVYLNVNTTEDTGRLIGRQGQTLADLQYLVNRVLFNKDQNAPKISVDVGGYRSQARDALVKKAHEAAEKVRRFGDIVELEPMGSSDRWIVHNALKDDPDIQTLSVEVEGTSKKAILLKPKSNA